MLPCVKFRGDQRMGLDRVFVARKFRAVCAVTFS
jgi:hypothetical protein